MVTYPTVNVIFGFAVSYSSLPNGIVLKDVPVAYPSGVMPKDFYPRLGMNVISKLRLLVDAPAKKMYVKLAGS